MALVDEINAQENASGQETTQQRPSLLAQHISQHGAEGLNQGYVNYALANGGGFGATAAGVVKDTEGNLHPIYNFNRSKEEIAYAKALRRGENLDTWYAKAKDESDAAAENYKALSDKLASLNAASDRALTASPFAVAAYQNAPSKEEISHLEEAVKQAEKDQQRKSDDFAAAKAYKDYRDTTRPVEEAYERGISYSDIYKSYEQSLDKLNKDRATLIKELNSIRHGGRYIGSNPEEQSAKQEADEANALARLEELERQIERVGGLQRYAQSRITSGRGAEAIIRQGEELARTAREQGAEISNANRKVKSFADYLPNGAAGYTNFRNWVGLLSNIPKGGGKLAEAARVIGEAVRDLPEAYNPISLIAELGIRKGEDAQHQPQDNWTKEQIDLYNYFYGSKEYGPEIAKKYAQQLNFAINTGEVNNQTAAQYQSGLDSNGSFLSKAGKTVGGLLGAVPDMALAAGDFQNKALDIIATGDYAGHRNATTHEQFSAFNRGRVEDLNRNTLSESIPVIGGKGWGDLYQLGQSSLQSLAMGNVLGEAATLGAFFVNAANSSFDEAMQRTGGNTQYASTVALLSGAAEVIGEKLSLDHLLKGGKIGSLSYILKQAGIEGSEEVATSLMNQFFDRVASTISGEQTAIQQQISDLVRSGMSYADAEKQVWRDTISDIAFDFVGGALSGGFSGVIQSGVSATQNKLWEMRKDSVLGKENAEGQREGGKKNASNDELSKMFDRALKRGDIRGAEQILQVIEQRGATAEEQEYGPVDPTANERMRRKLERQLNGERVNPQTENAEIVEESATNRQLAEEARVQAEFPSISPITMELVRRLDGKDFVTMAKSMSTQELAEVARYARYIGEEAKANLLEQIRLNPTYRYEEQTPAHTDEDDLLQNGPQNVAGQQVAPAGQITQPIQQNAAQTVKPGDSAAAENKLFNVTQNPNGVSTTSTESGTMSVPNTQEVTTNAGEQAVQQSEAEQTGKQQALTARGRLGQDSAGGRSQNVSLQPGRAIEVRGNVETLDESSAYPTRSSYTAKDGSKRERVTKGKKLLSIFDSNYENEAPQNGDMVFNGGTDIIVNPVKGTDAYDIIETAKKLGIENDVYVLSNIGNRSPVGVYVDGYVVDTDQTATGLSYDDKIFILCDSAGNVSFDNEYVGFRVFGHEFFHRGTHRALGFIYGKNNYSAFSKAYLQIANKVFEKAGFSDDVLHSICDEYLNRGYKKSYVSQGLSDYFDLISKGDSAEYEELMRGMVCDEILADVFGYAPTSHDEYSEPVIPRNILSQLRVSLFDALHNDLGMKILSDAEIDAFSGGWQSENGPVNNILLDTIRRVNSDSNVTNEEKAELANRLSKLFGENRSNGKESKRVRYANIDSWFDNYSPVNHEEEEVIPPFTSPEESADIPPITSREFADLISNATREELVRLSENASGDARTVFNLLAENPDFPRDKIVEYARRVADNHFGDGLTEGMTIFDPLDTADSKPAFVLEKYGIDSDEFYDFFIHASREDIALLKEYCKILVGTEEDKYTLVFNMAEDALGGRINEKNLSTVYSRAMASYDEYGGMPVDDFHRYNQDIEYNEYYSEFAPESSYYDIINRARKYDERHNSEEDLDELWKNSEPYYEEDKPNPLYYYAVSSKNKSSASETALKNTISALLSGNQGAIENLTDDDLFSALNYAVDRASPSTKGQPLADRLATAILENADQINENAQSRSWSPERGYRSNAVGNLTETQSRKLMRVINAALNEMERVGTSISNKPDSGITDYENKFGVATKYKAKGASWDSLARDDGKGNVSYAVAKRGRETVDLSQEYKPLRTDEAERRKRDDFNVRSREAAKVKTDDEIEEGFDEKRKPSIMRSLEKGNDIVESFGTYQPNGTRRRDVPVNPAKSTQKYQGRDIEDTGWIKPVEVSAKEVKQARDAVEAKGKEAQLKDKLKTLEAQRKYLEAVAKGMHDARSKLYGSEDIEQRKADLGYIADSLNEQLEQLDADLGYIAEGIIGTEEEAAIDNIIAQKERANAQLNALRDEYKHIEADDSASLRNVRSQIDSVISEISALSRQLDGVSKRADAANWGSNKRTLFQAKMAENPNGLREDKRSLPAPNRTESLTETGWPESTVARAKELNRAFKKSLVFSYAVSNQNTQATDAADFGEPTRGMGTGYVGMQRSRNKDGSLEFRTMYDDALPTRPATDKTRKPLNAPSTAYSNVAQAARSILNSKNSFLDFSKNRPKDIPSKVTNTMGQLREHVREMMEGDHPVNALMQLSNMVHEFENDDDLKVFSSDSIKKAVDELNDIYYNQDITNEEKARRMVENATKTLTLISKRIQLVDRGYNMLKTFTGPKKKRDNTTFWSKYKAMQLNPSTLFKAMDGFARDKNGSGYQIAKMIENGTALYTITQAQALKKLSDVSGLEGFKEFAEGNAKPFDIDGVKITEQQAVEFIMQVRNLQNTSVTSKDGPTTRLNTIDGFSIKDKDGNNTFIERSDDADGTNAEWFLNLAEAMENSLSPAAKKYLETATEILDDLGQQASDIRTNLIGTGFDNSINGTYYPINYDNKNGTAESQQNKPTSLFSGPMYQSRTRNVGGYVSIKNASDTMDRYIHWASNAIGYGEVAELLYAMDNTGSRMQNLSSLANDTLGQGYSEYIAKYIKDINEIPDGQKNDKSAFATLRRNMAAGALLGNLGVAAKQAASLWSAAGVLSPQALLSAETYFGGHSGAGNMILQSRMTGTSLDPTISEILHNDSFMGKLMKRSGVSEAMGKATAFVDYQTVKRLFAATVVDTKLSFPGLDQNSELFAQTVEAKFQDVVLQTQPIFVKNARAGYLRANDELTKAFAMFRTQPTQNLNSIVTAMGEYRALKGTEFGKAAGKKLRNTIIGQTASAVTFATLSAIVSFARHGLKKFRDDDDEISWAEVAKRIGLDSIESLAGISVVGGDIAKAIIDIATGGDTKEFYDMNAGVLTMLFDTVSSVTTFGTNVVKAIKDDKPLAVFNAGRQAADNLLQLGGIPANTVYRLLNSITMYSADALRALSGGKLGNRAEYDDALKMLDSYIKGDLTEEGAKTQAAKAFRKDQPENLLYNLGILSSLTSKDSKVDKGADWLNTRIQGKTEAERKAYKEDELARLGRNLNAGERIANYLADSALSAAQKDEAISKFATTSGYNVLYESLRAAGMTPKAAVAELGKTDNKTGLSTDIRSDDSLAELYAGKDNPGDTNDVPALDKKNTDEYVNFVSAMKVFRDTGNYSQLDKLVDQYSKLDDNTRAVIEAKDSAVKRYREYRSMGFSTKDYYNVKDAIKQAQIDLDLAANTGTVVKLVGLSKTNLTKAQVNKLINSDTLGISKTGKSLISVLSKYGYTIGDIGMFMYNTDWTNDDANGTLSQQEVVLALAKEKRLTDAQRSAIYEELKPLLRNEYKINHWYDKSYEYELNYLLQNGKTSGRT